MQRDLARHDSSYQLVDDLANRLFAASKIADRRAGSGFYTRLTELEAQFPNASVLMHKGGILPRAVQQFACKSAYLRSLPRLWSDPRLLSAARQLLGPNLAGHPG